MTQPLVLAILSIASFVLAFVSAVRADVHSQISKQYMVGSPSRDEYELKENAWEILCVIGIAISVMLGVLALVFWIV